MTPERWKRIQEVFASALEREPSARAVFLNEECRGDAELIREVGSLLASNDTPSSRLLDSPAIDVVSTTAPRGVRQSLAPGRRLGPYEVLAPLGAGGMGEVYRARDSKLRRDVAVKVLPQSLASDPEALARFEREALAVAALTHPNILAIFDFANENGVAYAVMELLEGETLRDKIDGGPIPPKQAVDYALQVAKGLSAAHEKGVVHRDLKPENIFVTRDDHLKILDFGLAKRVEKVESGKETSAPTASGHTQPGVVMGTLGYMSPEQVRGLPVDHRSDIFSFGAILYELLSGKRAFKRDTAADTMAAIMKEEPPELTASGRNISPALDHIVKHCLEKDRDHRFQTARDIAFNLSELSSVSPVASDAREVAAIMVRKRTPTALVAAGTVAVILVSFLLWRSKSAQRPSGPIRTEKRARIVVLPFENLGSPQDTYFAAGITEEISSRLGNLHRLEVISRVTANGYERKGKATRQVGSDLGVDFILDGTIQWDRSAGKEGRVRITPELIQVADDTQVWTERYDRVIADVFAIQSEVAENVVAAMGLKLLPGEKAALRKASTTNLDAYDLYVRGLETISRGQSKQNIETSIQMFQAAVDRDPEFVQALLQLAKSHLLIHWYLFDPDSNHVERAKDIVEQLGRIGPLLAETHIARAYYAYYARLDYPGALKEFEAARVLEPSNSDVFEGIGYVLRRQGRWGEAAVQLNEWVKLDPRNPSALSHYSFTCDVLGRYSESDRVFGLILSLNPSYGNTYARRAWLQVLWHGDVDRAQSIIGEAERVVGFQDDQALLAHAKFRVALIKHDYEGALQQLERETREALGNQFFFFPIDLLRGEVLDLMGTHQLAKSSFEAARRKLEDLISKNPKDFRYPSSLGIALAGLGLQEDALRASARAADLMPDSKDEWKANWRMVDSALTNAMLGRQTEAIAQLDVLLSRTGEISANVLRLDPRWDPLRSNPRFNALLVKHRTP